MNKRHNHFLLLFLLVSVLSLSIYGCGNRDTNQNDNGTSQTATDINEDNTNNQEGTTMNNDSNSANTTANSDEDFNNNGDRNETTASDSNGTTREGVIDDIGDAANDVIDGAEDMLEGTDNTANTNTADGTTKNR